MALYVGWDEVHNVHIEFPKYGNEEIELECKLSIILNGFRGFNTFSNEFYKTLFVYSIGMLYSWKSPKVTHELIRLRYFSTEYDEQL